MILIAQISQIIVWFECQPLEHSNVEFLKICHFCKSKTLLYFAQINSLIHTNSLTILEQILSNASHVFCNITQNDFWSFDLREETHGNNFQMSLHLSSLKLTLIENGNFTYHRFL